MQVVASKLPLVWQSYQLLNTCHLKCYLFSDSLPFTNMDRLTAEESVKIVETYYKSSNLNVGFHQSNKMFFSCEAHFSLGGYVNKQNCCIWGSENPEVVVRKSVHPKKGVFGENCGLEVFWKTTSKGSTSVTNPEVI